MSRRWIWTAAVIAAVNLSTPLRATELVSATTTINDIGQAFAFDFTGDPDLSSVQITDTVTGIRVDWLFIPGGSNYDNVKLRAKLTLADVDARVGFDTLINGSPTSVPAFAENYSQTLTISDELLAGLLGGTYGQLEGALRILATNIPELVAFFDEGGSLQATLTLVTDSQPGGGGNPVPEPASFLVWGLIGAAGFGFKRRLRRKED